MTISSHRLPPALYQHEETTIGVTGMQNFLTLEQRGRQSRCAKTAVGNASDERTYTLTSIWEKKYGKNANHLKLKAKDPHPHKRQKRTHQPAQGNAGRNESYGAPHSAPHGNHGGRQTHPSAVDNRPPKPVSKPKPDPNTPMHPSWEAKLKAKTMQATAVPKGNKVIFD